MLNRSLLRTKVLRSLYSHVQCSSRSVEKTIGEYNASLQSCYELSYFILQLLVEVGHYASERQEIAKQKLRPTHADLNPKRRFVENSVLKELERSEHVAKVLKGSKLKWTNHHEVVVDVYNQIINSSFYEPYLDGVSSDREIVVKILSTLIEDNETVIQALEDISILWIDDLGYALRQAICEVEGNPSSMFNNDDDREFGEKLLLHSISHYEEYMSVVENNSENWEIERVAMMDKLILIVAISELVGCPTIPIKVTLNEYIEISKYYSTPQSYNFINGVLYRVIKELEDRIKKTGRGLITTKVEKR